MRVNTKSYGVTSGNARYNCPFCKETRGRFFINVDRSSKRFGLWICHNCNRKGGTDREAGTEFFTEWEEEDQEEAEIQYINYNVTMESPYLQQFLESRAIKTKHKTLPVTVSKQIDDQKKTPFEYRLALKALSLKGKCFYNFRSIFKGIDPKVLFSPSSFENIGRKSHAVLINPESAFISNKDKKRIIPVICEGDMGAWSIYHDDGQFIYLGMAVLGKFISGVQANWFSRFPTVFLMPDNDQSDLEISQNIRRLMFAGCEDIRVYDKSQYTGPKADANDLLQADRNFFKSDLFKTIQIF